MTVKVVVGVVVEAVLGLLLFVETLSVTVVVEAVAIAVIKVVAAKVPRAVRYCCLDNPKSR